MKKQVLLALNAVLIAALACNLFTPQAGPTPAPPATQASPATEPPATQAAPTAEQPAPTTPPEIVLPPDVRGPIFADFPLSPVNLPEAFSGDYSLPADLNAVQGMDLVGLSAAQRSLLEQNGFVVAVPQPGQYQEFYQFYESLRYVTDQPVFATTDAVFHVYHLIFDKMLRDLERESFIRDIGLLTSAMLAQAGRDYEGSRGTPMEEPALRNLAFFGVAARLLELPDAIPPAAQPLVDAELALIMAAAGPDLSPIWDREDLPRELKLIEDYSQYIPRGHYTRSDALKRYFRAMMWYGRLTFRLRDDFETRRAALLVYSLRSASADGQPAIQFWRNVYEPTVFIVGKADDPGIYEYGALADAVFGPAYDPARLADDALLGQFRSAALKLPPPQVNSMWVWINEDRDEATRGFRFMGQRFTLDQYVFGQLIWRKVGTPDKPRGLPVALDFFAALGSEEALGILKEMGEDQYVNYPEQMAKVRSAVSALELDSWTQNLYWSWLFSLRPLFEPKDGRFPAFMRTQAWNRKELHTALGSWTELKHDTILYSKQVMAEMGGGAPEKPPKGWVEPNPEAYARLLALAEMTRTGLASRDMLSDLTNANLANLIDLLDFMKTAAEKQLAGQELDESEYWRIQFFGATLEQLTIAASDCESADPASCRDIRDRKAALVADVATGLAPDGSLVALEEAIGQPAPIYVILPGSPLRLAVGAVFSYYEFPVPVSDRLTDEAWQAQVEAGQAPPHPAWTGLFLAP